ncbi:DUF1565 domain-containing protein [Aequorivita sp. F47161]|uniref:DUF1565 domain-containing protein n=1 Tax=Aequorivita vitellina TaxID=2874475 RepID=A0A9X1QYQ9_9FLAO|nr:DUF1565 domain-containing protein [Aequorivita vitellina]MCG2419024.1 DUF1565 domain-containing protein [Aequorivita vitellina]
MKKLFLLLLTIVVMNAQAQEDCTQIPNGNFQNWTGNDDPVNWLTTNMGDKYGTPTVGFDMRNVFKTPGKYGNGVRIKNASVLEMLKAEKPAEFAKLPASIKEQLRKSSFSGSLFTCQGNCEGATLSENEIFMRKNMFFPLSKTPGALCGYYKANLKEGDKLWILPYLAIENDMPAGGVMPGETASVITKNASDWTPFRIPLRILPDRTPVKALIQMQMVGSGFPVTPPYGMSALELAQRYPSTDGSEVFIDELCFCGEADVIDPDDPILDSIDMGTGTSGADPEDDQNNDNSEEIYIATNGNDTNSGTNSSPFATMQKALNVAQGKRLQGKPVKIIVKNGTYRQEANFNGTGNTSLPPLIIEAETSHQAIFIGSEPITENPNWQTQTQGLYMSNKGKLHPNQQPEFNIANYGNPMDTSVPALVVNGVQLKHQQGGDLRNIPNAYVYSPQLFMVNPGAASLSSAIVEVSVRKNAINVTNGGNITVKGLRLKGFPQASIPQLNEQQMPGLEGVQAVNCQYE